MKYLTKDIMEGDPSNEKLQQKYKEADEKNCIEYKKAKTRLPKDFIDIFERNDCFHDAYVPEISIITDYKALVKEVKANSTKIRIITIGYGDDFGAWEILIYNIKEIYCEYLLDTSTGSIGSFIYDELLIEDKQHISWEIAFSGGLNLKMVFKNITIRELSKEEIEIYRQPIKAKKTKRKSEA